MANISTNNNILTLLNPRIIKKDNELFLTILVCLGLQNDYSNSIFFKLNEKLISTYNNNEIYDILAAFRKSKIEFANILYNGFDNYKIGEDYFISRSLYEYLTNDNDEEHKLNENIYEDNINNEDLNFILSIKNHDINSFNEYFNYQLPENMSFIGRNINGTDIISLVIKKIYDLPDGTHQYEYSSLIDIFGLQINGVFVIGYSDNNNVELNQNIKEVINDVLEYLKCKKEENGRYTIDLNQYIDPEKTNFMIANNDEDKTYIMEDFIIDDNFNINKEYYDIISNTSIDRYYMLQKSLSRTFTIDELNNLYSTFFAIISEYTTINEYLYPNNVYRFVIDYFKNYQNDDGLNAIDIILGSTITTTITNTNISNCSCNSSNNCLLAEESSASNNNLNGNNQSVDLSMMTCSEKYKAAMNQYLIDMLSNINFYCDWMWMENNDDNEISDINLETINGNTGLVPNIPMIDLLIKLLTEFLDLGYNLSPNTSTTKCGCHTKNCPDFSNNILDNGLDKTHCSNCNIIENYIKVLNWTKEGKLEENKNKINIYGKQFAHLLPGLIFN